MIIAFKTLTLRRLCEDDAVAVAKYGVGPAAGLRGRIADLRAAGTIADLLVGNPRVGGASGGFLTLNLFTGTLSTWAANHPIPRTNASGMVDWTRTTRIQLIKIEVV